jgi:hypothetical protein
LLLFFKKEGLSSKQRIEYGREAAAGGRGVALADRSSQWDGKGKISDEGAKRQRICGQPHIPCSQFINLTSFITVQYRVLLRSGIRRNPQSKLLQLTGISRSGPILSLEIRSRNFPANVYPPDFPCRTACPIRGIAFIPSKEIFKRERQ